MQVNVFDLGNICIYKFFSVEEIQCQGQHLAELKLVSVDARYIKKLLLPTTDFAGALLLAM